MTELSRDARALLARARHRDGPSSADRDRIRGQLEQVWHTSRVDESGASEPPAPAFVTRLQPPAAAALMLVFGFVAPEAPRAAAARPIVAAVHGGSPATARSAPGVFDASPAPPSAAIETPASQPSAASSPPDSVEGARPNRGVRGPRVRGIRKTKRVESSSAPATDSMPAVPELEPATPETVAARQALREPQQPAATEVASGAEVEAGPPRNLSPEGGASGDSAPVQRREGFAPQPIAEELAWVDAAQEALRAGRPTRALRLVQEHAFRFPRGALAPERMAVQALSLCALQRRAAAREVIATLAARAPESPLLSRVRRECRFSR